MLNDSPAPRLSWDIGTAYDLFMSLDALHHPEEFGLRGAWAAGVRSRLPAPERELLQEIHATFFIKPIHWVYHLPEPKDGATALETLAQIPPAQRLRHLTIHPALPAEAGEVFDKVSNQGHWAKEDQKNLYALNYGKLSRKEIITLLDVWAKARQIGEPYLEALRAYYEAFFAEEEGRIRPALEKAVQRSQELAKRLDVMDVLGEISEGVHFTGHLDVSEIILIPSFWSTPLVIDMRISPGVMLFLFGARPPDASLVPGEVVPDALFRSLKALADPTRLRILRYLVTEPLTPVHLARRLRLRAPTVIHHLGTLRLAGLVHLALGPDRKVHYTARPEAVNAMFKALKEFLEKDKLDG